jgi:hypothetical protein
MVHHLVVRMAPPSPCIKGSTPNDLRSYFKPQSSKCTSRHSQPAARNSVGKVRLLICVSACPKLSFASGCIECREPTNQCIRNHCQRALTSVRTNLLLSCCLPQDMFGAASQPISPSLTTVKVRLLICVSACPELSCASG